MTITYLTSSRSKRLPTYIVGPVVETAATVEIHLKSGGTLHAATFAAPKPLGQIRFYAIPLPGAGIVFPVLWIAGLDLHGTVVACLAPATARNGISPLSACA
jgi:hypothetical protein